jgi:hypothetical protein
MDSMRSVSKKPSEAKTQPPTTTVTEQPTSNARSTSPPDALQELKDQLAVMSERLFSIESAATSTFDPPKKKTSQVIRLDPTEEETFGDITESKTSLEAGYLGDMANKLGFAHVTSFTNLRNLLMGTPKRPKGHPDIRIFLAGITNNANVLDPAIDYGRYYYGIINFYRYVHQAFMQSEDLLCGLSDPPQHLRAHVYVYLSYAAALFLLQDDPSTWDGRCVSGLASALRGGTLSLQSDPLKHARNPVRDMLTLALTGAAVPLNDDSSSDDEDDEDDDNDAPTTRKGRAERAATKKSSRGNRGRKRNKKKKKG